MRTATREQRSICAGKQSKHKPQYLAATVTPFLDFVRSDREHERALRAVRGCFISTSHLPNQVFRPECERFRLFDFDDVLEEGFWSLLTNVASSSVEMQSGTYWK